uniref:PGG domain-containing protein n=1 Tax=Triticum urartu TaxID=4572 RepID=A0A8R7R3J9_TRIUA
MEDPGEQNGNAHAPVAAGNTLDEPQQLQQDGADEAELQQLQQEGANEEAELLWKLRKYLVLMAILVAAITFQAGLAPPGGFWQHNDEHGHVASDIVMKSSYPRRYLAFFYYNTMAFGASLLVLILLLLRELTHKAAWLRALQFAMILGLLGLMGAFAAGSCREVRTSAYIWVLLLGISAYVTLHEVFFKHLAPERLRKFLSGVSERWKGTPGDIFTSSKPDEQKASNAERVADEGVTSIQMEEPERNGSSVQVLAEEEKKKKEKEAADREEDLERNRSSLLVLATLVATVTYVAGLTPPGGFWSDDNKNHIPGDPVLRDHYPRRFKAFFYCNATAFAGSLVIIIMVLSQTAVDPVVKSNALRLCVVVSLFGLMGAYAAGSCREVHTSIYVFALVGTVLLYLIIQCIEPALSKLACIANTITRVKERNKEMVRKLRDFITDLLKSPIPVQDQSDNSTPGTDGKDFQKLRTYLLLLGILAATVTFQAGLNPPGGFWTDNSDGHIAGDPILETISPKRYKAFFYCNATAFVASLAIIILLQSQLITIHAMKRYVLQTAMTLVLFGLMGAYVAGSSRKFSTSIYVFVLVLLVFAYVVLHILYERALGNTGSTAGSTESTAGNTESTVGNTGVSMPETPPNPSSSEPTLEEKKDLTSQNPSSSEPTPEEKKDLQKRRKFLMLLAILAASITYQTGISPPGGFWTNGHRAGYPVFRDEFRNRYRVFFYFNATAFMASLAVILLLVNKRLCNKGLRCHALCACVLVDLISLMGAFATGSCREVPTSGYVILVVLAVFVYVIIQVLVLTPKDKWKELLRPSKNQHSSMNHTRSIHDTDSKRTEHKWRKDLMLIGTLAVTVTYQAGLLPPGGVWPDDQDGHFAGDPILHDTNLTRYKVFFYCNATAFMASMVMVILLLNNTISKHKRSLFAMKTAMVLDLLGLLGAYAAGSCRKLKTSAYIFALVIAVIIYIVIHVLLSFDEVARLVKQKGKRWVRCLKRCFCCN